METLQEQIQEKVNNIKKDVVERFKIGFSLNVSEDAVNINTIDNWLNNSLSVRFTAYLEKVTSERVITYTPVPLRGIDHTLSALPAWMQKGIFVPKYKQIPVIYQRVRIPKDQDYLKHKFEKSWTINPHIQS